MTKPSRTAAGRQQRYAARHAPLTIYADTSAIDAVIDGIEAELDEAVRPAAQAGSEVLYQAVLRNVKRIKKQTGNLEESIYQVYSKDNSGEHKATYHISWNHLVAPHGFLVEYGHFQKYKVYMGSDGKWYTNKEAPLPTPKKVGAQSFMRNAMDQFPAAEKAVVTELLHRVGRSA